MKMKKITVAVVMASAAATGIVGCHDSKDRPNPTPTTTVEVFDGYATACTVTYNTIPATEVRSGVYEFDIYIPPFSIIEAINCVDVDTDVELPDLSGVNMEGGGVVSPITTLIVAAARAQNPGADPTNLSEEALAAAKATIVEKFDLGSYDPLDPETANYVDTIDEPESQATMQLGLALTTLLKTIVAASPADAEAALAALATAIVNTEGTIELADATSVQTLLESAAEANPDLTAVFEDVYTNGVDAIVAIAGAENVNLAAGIAQAVGQVIDDGGTLEEVAAIDLEAIEPIDVGTGGGGEPVTPPTGGTGGSGS